MNLSLMLTHSHATSTLRLLLCTSLLAGLPLLTACGDDDDGGGGGNGGNGVGNDLTLDELPPVLADAACTAFDRCLGELGSLFFGTDCETAFAADFANSDLPNIKAKVEAGTVTYDPSKVPACLEAFRSSDCSGLGSDAPDACLEAIAGTVADGGACEIDEECIGDSFCEIDLQCPGTCFARKPLGESCHSDEECRGSLYCPDDTCRNPQTEGQECGGETGLECVFGLQCVGEDDDAGTSGSCLTVDDAFAAGVGDSCDLDESTFCRAGLSCILDEATPAGATFVCAERVARGGDCTIGFPDQCPSGQYCPVNPDQAQFTGTCTDMPGNGEDCEIGLDENEFCAPGLICHDSVCVTPQPIGGACDDDGVCFSDNCENSVCVAEDPCD